MERSDELRDVMLQFYSALSSGDLAFIDRHFSTDEAVRGIGTDPSEWWSGRKLIDVWKEQIAALAVDMLIERINQKGEPAPPRTVKPDFHLKLRESTGFTDSI